MAHITLDNEFPGIRGPMTYRPETAKPLNELVDVLLRGPNSADAGRARIDRHLRVGTERLPLLPDHSRRRRRASSRWRRAARRRRSKSIRSARRSRAKLKALLVDCREGRRERQVVTAEDVARARAEGATDLEIHDTVLIAAVFCLCNRYVDGLATWAPADPDFYRQRAAVIAANGYTASTLQTDSQ